MTSLLTYANMGLLNHADIIGSVTNGQSDGLLWRSLQQTHHLSNHSRAINTGAEESVGLCEAIRQLVGTTVGM